MTLDHLYHQNGMKWKIPNRKSKHWFDESESDEIREKLLSMIISFNFDFESKVEIILEQRGWVLITQQNLQKFEFFYCAPLKIQIFTNFAGW